MRIPRQRRLAPRRCRRSSGLVALALMTLSPFASALTFEQVPEANLDLSALGQIGVAGSFDGISLYQYEGQNEQPISRNGSEYLLTRLPNGIFTSIAATDASVQDMCASYLSSGEMAGVVLAGNFTSVDGVQTQGVALFNLTSTEFVPLDGLSGQVNALLCDGETSRVYVGGSFRHTNSTNAMVWVHGQGWTSLPFAGFNGPVYSITKTSDNHIIFGGSFTGLGNTTTSTATDGQVINLSNANVTSGSSSSTPGFDNPRNIICNTEGTDGANNTWLLQDDSPGYLQASFGFGFEPVKLRLWNTRQDGRGTKTWRFTALPLGGILNMTYIDPQSGQNNSCTSECPLSNDPATPFQDFHFVNPVGMNAFRVDISDFYGSGGGLNGLQIFSEDIFAYAINEFNEPTCDGIGIQSPSAATVTGPWKESPSLESSSRYLTAQISSGNSQDPVSVVFFPKIEESGNYTVEMYTPGCLQDETCSQRGQVNVTGIMSSAADGKFDTTLYQTNNFDKYDQIYFGYIEAGADGFRPSVTLAPLSGQSLDNLTIVAQRVGFTLLNSTGGLNGLYDFDPETASVDTKTFSSSAVNKLGVGFTSSSAVHQLVTMNDLVIVAGNFTSDEARNIVAVNSADQSVQSLDGGLNGEVRSMHLEGSLLYVGGSFDNNQNDSFTGLNNIAVYSRNDNKWAPLGAGVNGNVLHVVPMQLNITNDQPEVVIAITGDFNQINEFDGNTARSVSGFAIWVPSQENWLQNLDGLYPSYNGILTASVLDLPEDGVALFAGSMSSATTGANGAVTLGETLGHFPVRIQAPRAGSSSMSRRDVLSDGEVNGVVTGAFYNTDDRNLTVLAGHFTAQGNNGSLVNNLVIINGTDNNAISGIGSSIAENSTFVALAIFQDTLFAGGDVRGVVNGNEVQGLMTYDLANTTLGTQPPGLNGGNGTVSAIAVRPDSTEVYVAGTFAAAGSLDCPGVCLYDTELSQWNRPGISLEGAVGALLWTSSSRLVAGGNMTVDGSPVPLAVYDASEQTWSSFPGAEELPGPVNVMTRGSRSGDKLWVSGTTSNGSVYLMKYDGSRWLVADQQLSNDTVIYSLQMFTTTSSHDDTDILDSKQVLMLTGSVGVPEYGSASAAIFNGTHFRPYALTTNSRNAVGTISGIFTQNTDFFTDNSGNLALGFVVLIGLAIALGLTFILVIAGLFLDRLRKKREGYSPAPTSMYDRGSGLRRIPPQELLESLGKGRPGAPRI